MNQGALHFESTLNNSNFENGINKIQSGIRAASDTAKKEASSMDSTFKNLGVAIGGYFSAQALIGFSKKLIEVRGEFQKTEIAFGTMLGSQEKAQALMAQMVTLAVKTPFSLQEVSTGAKQLLAYQVPANQVVDVLTRMGNIASGLGVPLSRLNLVYGQVKAKGRLMGDDLRQFTEAGIPMIAELAKKFKVTESAISDMVSAGKVGFKDVEEVLYSMTNEGGMFFNLMEKQSKSVSGQISNLGDAFDQVLNDIGKANDGIISGTLGVASDMIENYQKMLDLIGALALSYGTYRAAIMFTAAAQSMANKTIASEVGLLGFSTKMKLGRALVTQKQTAATLMEAKAEQSATQAKYLTLQAEVSTLAVKRQKLVAIAAEKSATAQAAVVQLALGRAELKSNASKLTSSQMVTSAKNLEVLQNKVIGLQETAGIARKNAMTASTKFYTTQKQLENTATALGNTSKKVELAGDAASVASKNLNTIATAKLTFAQKIQTVATNLAARATTFLNATLLANPYAVIAALVAALGYAVYKYATATTAAEESQKRMNEDLKNSIPAISETETKLKALVKVVQDQNSTDDQRATAIRKIQSLTNGRLSQLDLEAIKTGKATGMITKYIEALKLEAEAKRLITEMGRIDADVEELDINKNKFGFSDLVDDFTDFDTEMKWSLSERKKIRVKRTIESKKAEKAELDKKLMALSKKDVNIVDEDPGTGSGGYQGKTRGTEGWYKEEIQRLESLKESAIVGGKAWKSYSAQIENYNNLMNPKKGTKKNTLGSDAQLAEIFPSGSIKELQQRAQLINDAIEVGVDNQIKLRKLDKFGKDKDKKGNPFLTGEVVSREAAYKKVDEINDQIKKLQRKSFDDEMSELERQWTIKNKVSEAYGLEFSKAAYPQLSGSYFEDVQSKFESFDKTIKSGGTLSEEQLLQWTKLKGILDDLGGEKSRSEKVKKDLDLIKNEATNTYAYLAELKKRQTEGEGDNSMEGIKIREYLKSEEEETLAGIRSSYLNFLKEHQTFEEKKVLITQKYADLRREIMSDETTTPEQKNNALKAAGTAEGLELSGSFLEGIRNNPEWAKAFEDLGNVTLSQLKVLRGTLSAELKNLIESGKGTPVELKALGDTIKEIDASILNRNPFSALADAIRNLGNEADTTKSKLEKIKDVVKAAGATADLLNEGIGQGVGIMEDLGVQFSEETKAIIGDIQTTLGGVSDLASGIVSMNPAQILKGIAGVVKGLAGMFNKDRKKEKNIKAWAAEVENLKVQYEDLQRAISKSLGDDSYKQQQAAIRNLKQQQQVLKNMAAEEGGKKKKDQGKIDEWNAQINQINVQIGEVFDNMANQIAQTNAKDLASQLSDALIEAYSKGETAAEAYGKVADDVMKNAVKNALKMQLLEGPMQDVIKQLIKNMGFGEDGSGSFDGLSDSERQQIKDMMAQASQNYMDALGAAGDLFEGGLLSNTALEGAVKGVSEETASVIAGQLNAIRQNQGEMLTISQESILIFRANHLQLVQIEYNTRYLKHIYKHLSGLDIDPFRASGIT